MYYIVILVLTVCYLYLCVVYFSLSLLVIAAHDLPNVVSIGIQDPFVSVFIDDQKLKTKPHMNAGSSPVWNQSMLFNIDCPPTEILG